MKRPKGMGPGPKLRPTNNVHTITKSQALSTVQTMKSRLTSMCMLLGATCQRHGGLVFTREQIETTDPEQLHISDEGDTIKVWWGNNKPATPAPLAIVQDDDDDGDDLDAG